MEEMRIGKKNNQVRVIIVLFIGLFIMPLIVPVSTDETRNSTVDNNGKILFFKYYILSDIILVIINFLCTYSSGRYTNDDSGLVRDSLVHPYGNLQQKYKVC